MTILVHAAAGGVGIAALQLARLCRATIIATVGSDAKLEVVRAEGAHHAQNYATHDFEPWVRRITNGRGVDLVLDSVGGDSFRKSYRLLAPMGHLVAFGAATMMPAGPRPNWVSLALKYLLRPRIDPLGMIGENRTVSGFNLVHLFAEREMGQRSIEALTRLWNDGHLRPRVFKVYPLARAGEAQEALRSRATVGKIVLGVGSPSG
jgi:alcohol dehydrogenase